MSIQEIIKILTDSGIEPNEANIEVKLLLEHFADYTIKDIILGNKLDNEKLKIVEEKARLRASTRYPIQHIIGFANFMDEKFVVNKNVLIPRDETEILARKAIGIIKNKGYKNALDIGTGSGCIACMIAKHTDCQVLGIDISNEALSTALDNASALNLFNKAIFRKSDIYSNIKDYEKFDIIISNPPYIPISQKKYLQKEVTFDPEIALFAQDEKGIEFYEKIIKDAPNYLNKNGHLLFEAGINQASYIVKLMSKRGFTNIKIIQDMSGIDRIIFGNLK